MTSNEAPDLPRPVIMDQRWVDLVFLHWRVDPALVAPWMPPGARPDTYDGSSWVGLIGFEMRDAGFGRGHPVPYLGTFGEINVRLYSTDDRGRRGVVFRSLETERLALVAADQPGAGALPLGAASRSTATTKSWATAHAASPRRTGAPAPTSPYAPGARTAATTRSGCS